jgi:uncharacterized protein (TIGR03083 family)
MTSDQERLARYVEIWRGAVDDAVVLLRDLREDDWARPTDLAGWTVRDVAAHLAHIESELSGVEQPRVDVPELDHLTAPSAMYTEAGLIARGSLSSSELVDELVRAADVRYEQLRSDPPTDATADPPITPGGMPWDWETMLRNRPLDVWMHEQDIRRAVGRPGGMNSDAAAHVATVFTMSFAFSVGKKVSPPAGTTVLLDVSGVNPVHLAVEMNDAGRCVPLNRDPSSPTVALDMDLETFVVLGGGRRPTEQVPVRVVGDEDLGRRVLDALAVTP